MNSETETLKEEDLVKVSSHFAFTISSIAMYLLGLDNVYEFRKEEYSYRRSFRTYGIS
jgi:hypothetical protein